MTPAARVAEAITLLQATDDTPRPADAVVQQHFRSHRYIGSKDRRAIGDLVFGIWRHFGRLSWHLGQLGADPEPRALTLAYLALVASEDAAVHFGGDGKHGPEALSPSEVELVGKLADRSLEPDEMPESVAVECPDWAEGDLLASLGDAFAAEMRALLAEAPMDLRVARRKSKRDTIAGVLVGEGFAASSTPHSPDGIRLTGRSSILNHKLYRDGVIEVQDEGSQIISLMCDVSPGQQVVDFCAGACGKSLALGDIMGGAGRIVACDVSQDRLNRGKARFARAGLDNIEPRLLRDEKDGWIAKQKGKFDRVLVDAPCSGSGAWRRNPWARWRAPDLAQLLDLQARILASAARLVKPGGRLIYATCSLLESENAQQVKQFCLRNPEFCPLSLSVMDELGGSDGTLVLTPLRHQTDGFFISVMERREKA